MKKTITLLAAGFATLATASAQSLVAGWDFANLSSGDTAINSNFSDLGDISDGVAAGAYGTFDLTSLDASGFNPDYNISTGTPRSISANRVIDFTDNRIGSLGDEGAVIFNASSNGKFVDFDLSLGSSFSDFELTYAAALINPGDSASIQWSYDAGSGFTNWGTSQSVTSTGGDEFALSALSGVSASDLTVRATLSVGTGDAFILDNVQVGAVPEPSSFALIAGVLSIAFVGARRRK